MRRNDLSLFYSQSSSYAIFPLALQLTESFVLNPVLVVGCLESLIPRLALAIKHISFMVLIECWSLLFRPEPRTITKQLPSPDEMWAVGNPALCTGLLISDTFSVKMNFSSLADGLWGRTSKRRNLPVALSCKLIFKKETATCINFGFYSFCQDKWLLPGTGSLMMLAV